MSKRLCICMCCDFFYPRLGGVEMHIWSLSQCLIRRGHKVIVVTRAYDDRKGVRWMSSGLKVYYTPLYACLDGGAVTFPTFFSFFPLFRDILIREGVDIVHAHQSTSQMTHECILHAKTMHHRVRVVYSSHSLFNLADVASLNLNKLLKWTLCGVDHCICVSHTCRENLHLRTGVPPDRISTVPNAVDSTRFQPMARGRQVSAHSSSAAEPTQSGGGAQSVECVPEGCTNMEGRINVVVVSRQVYRKGTDLLAQVIPRVCRKHPRVHFIVGGDGPKVVLLEEMREKYHLQDRVEMLGALPHSRVREVMSRGHIFLNCSLTESFCIAILEAACCGLFVVATRVGGVPEVLPPHMVLFARAEVDDLVQQLSNAFEKLPQCDPWQFHNCVAKLYNWDSVAEKTEGIYRRVMKLPNVDFVDRIKFSLQAGWVLGLIAAIITAMDLLLWTILSLLRPADNIELAADFAVSKQGRVGTREDAPGNSPKSTM